MHELQVNYESLKPGELTRCPIEPAHTIEGKPIAVKWIVGARHPATGLPVYADFDREMIEPLRAIGKLDGAEWRLSRADGNEYLIAIDKKVDRDAIRFIHELATGRRLARNQSVRPINGNLSDLRLANLTVVPSRAKRGPATWTKTPLDDRTYQRVQDALESFDRLKLKRHHVKLMPIIFDGNLADGTPVAIKFVCGLRNEDTNKLRFVILDRGVAARIAGSELEGFAWSACRVKGGGEELRIIHTVSRTLASIIYQLGNPTEPIPPGHVVSTEDGNPLNLCLDNLAVRKSSHKGTRN